MTYVATAISQAVHRHVAKACTKAIPHFARRGAHTDVHYVDSQFFDSNIPARAVHIALGTWIRIGR